MHGNLRKILKSFSIFILLFFYFNFKFCVFLYSIDWKKIKLTFLCDFWFISEKYSCFVDVKFSSFRVRIPRSEITEYCLLFFIFLIFIIQFLIIFVCGPHSEILLRLFKIKNWQNNKLADLKRITRNKMLPTLSLLN